MSNERTEEEKYYLKRFFLDLSVVLILAFLLITLIFIALYLDKDSRDCVSDPIKYYHNKTNDQCFCLSQGYNNPTVKIHIEPDIEKDLENIKKLFENEE